MTTRSTTTPGWLKAALICLLAIPVSLGACGEREAGAPPLQPGEFVDIMVALRQAERAVEREAHEDSVEIEFDRRKAEILERHQVSEADVRAFLERHRHRPQVVTAVWDSIAQRLRPVSATPEQGDPLLEDGW